MIFCPKKTISVESACFLVFRRIDEDTSLDLFSLICRLLFRETGLSDFSNPEHCRGAWSAYFQCNGGGDGFITEPQEALDPADYFVCFKHYLPLVATE